MITWLKKHWLSLVTLLVMSGLITYFYGCEPKVTSLVDRTQMVTRMELQLELERFIDLAQLRMLDLDRQEALRTIILENAFILVRGQPLNPIGIISAVAAIYGVGQGACNVTKVVKGVKKKKKVNNG